MCLTCRRSVTELNVSMTEGTAPSGSLTSTKNALTPNTVPSSTITASVTTGATTSNVFMTEGTVANTRTVTHSATSTATGYTTTDSAMKLAMLRNVTGTAVIVKGNPTQNLKCRAL